MYNNLNEFEYEFGILVFSATFNYIEKVFILWELHSKILVGDKNLL
jgi:hypothetical protein